MDIAFLQFWVSRGSWAVGVFFENLGCLAFQGITFRGLGRNFRPRFVAVSVQSVHVFGN